MKVVISNDKGKTFQIELEENEADFLKGKRVGDSISGDPLNLQGYKLEITGGSDKDGFPMRKGIQSTGRVKKILKDGTGIKQSEKGVRHRKTVRGEIVSEQTEQVNCKVNKQGEKELKALLGSSEKNGDQASD